MHMFIAGIRLLSDVTLWTKDSRLAQAASGLGFVILLHRNQQ